MLEKNEKKKIIIERQIFIQLTYNRCIDSALLINTSFTLWNNKSLKEHSAYLELKDQDGSGKQIKKYRGIRNRLM
jgi:hypothetical protein